MKLNKGLRIFSVTVSWPSA